MPAWQWIHLDLASSIDMFIWFETLAAPHGPSFPSITTWQRRFYFLHYS
jgi:hypothetical protein